MLRIILNQGCKGMGLMAIAASVAFTALEDGFHMRELATGLDLVSSCVLPDGRVLAIEKKGMITLIKQNGAKSTFLDWTKNTRDDHEAGMMQVIADPDFLTNKYVYMQYSNKQIGTNAHDWVSRFKVVGDAIDPTSEKKILDLGDAGPNYHHGDGLAISPDKKYLFICSGSRHGGGSNPEGAAAAANKTVLEGKMHRVMIPEGTIPTDNPFYATNSGDARAVYYYGLRNPATPSFHPTTGKLWFCDIQPVGSVDEVNEGGPPGTGYGYGGGGTAQPLWISSKVGFPGRAMIGGLWYTGNNFPAKYKNHFFVGNVGRGNGLLKVIGPDDKPTDVMDFGPFIQGDQKIDDFNPIDVKMDAGGAIYVSTRFQTENVSWTKGKVVKVWYGPTEPVIPTTSIAGRARAIANYRMSWTNLSTGGLMIHVLREGRQTIGLQSLDGRIVSERTVDGVGAIQLSTSARGMHILTWKSGSLETAIKVML